MGANVNPYARIAAHLRTARCICRNICMPETADLADLCRKNGRRLTGQRRVIADSEMDRRRARRPREVPRDQLELVQGPIGLIDLRRRSRAASA